MLFLDFSRLARHPRDTFWSQLLAIPLTFAITSFIGLVIASSSTVIFGKAVLNPLDLLSLRLDRAPYDAGTRAGVFFISTSFALGQIGTNIAANVLSAGSDLTALLPRYMTIRRGGESTSYTSSSCETFAHAFLPIRPLECRNCPVHLPLEVRRREFEVSCAGV